MNQLEKIVKKDFELISPFIIRDEGNVPPLILFHFKEIDPKVQEAMNMTVQSDSIDVENGFFVPMSRQSVLENKEVFMEFMATIMAALTTVGIAKELLSVVIAVTGEAIKVDSKTKKKEASANLFIVSGIDSKGNTFTRAQEIKLKMGTDSVICELIDSELLDEGVDNTGNVFIGEDFFDMYNKNVKQIPEDKKNLGILETSKEKYKDDPAGFTADLVDSAMHATVLLDSIKQSEKT